MDIEIAFKLKPIVSRNSVVGKGMASGVEGSLWGGGGGGLRGDGCTINSPLVFIGWFTAPVLERSSNQNAKLCSW